MVGILNEESENQLIDLISTYGENNIIEYAQESIKHKEERLKEHLKD